MGTREQLHKEFGKRLGNLSPEEALTALERYFTHLSVEEKTVLNLFYALKGVKTPVRNKEIAERLRKSPERVTKIRERALERLRSHIRNE